MAFGQGGARQGAQALRGRGDVDALGDQLGEFTERGFGFGSHADERADGGAAEAAGGIRLDGVTGGFGRGRIGILAEDLAPSAVENDEAVAFETASQSFLGAIPEDDRIDRILSPEVHFPPRLRVVFPGVGLGS